MGVELSRVENDGRGIVQGRKMMGEELSRVENDGNGIV